ncbi:MAG: hypothetical protein WCF04_07965 [Candidatus Nanopelagicales bacterium]
MARASRARALPSTPDPRLAQAPGGAPAAGRSPAAGHPKDATGAATPAQSPAPRRPVRTEPEYLVRGTGCVSGHVRGRELETERIGRVPSRRSTRIGLALVLWCIVGLAFLVDPKWASFGIRLAVVWLALSAIVMRRAGHRGHCWRTRTWRHAWGGFAT